MPPHMCVSKHNENTCAAFVVNINGAKLHESSKRLENNCSILQVDVWIRCLVLRWLERQNLQDIIIRGEGKQHSKLSVITITATDSEEDLRFLLEMRK